MTDSLACAELKTPLVLRTSASSVGLLSQCAISRVVRSLARWLAFAVCKQPGTNRHVSSPSFPRNKLQVLVIPLSHTIALGYVWLWMLKFDVCHIECLDICMKY